MRQGSEESQKCIHHQTSYHGSQLELIYTGKLWETVEDTFRISQWKGEELGYCAATYHPSLSSGLLLVTLNL